MNYNLLTITPNNYEDLAKKGVLDLIANFSENGFFNKTINLFPIGRESRKVKLTENSEIIEYGWKTQFKILNRFRIIKYLGVFKILFNLIFVFPFIIRKENISIIRSTDPYLNGFIGYIYSRIFKIPLVISLHADYDMIYNLGGPSFTIFGSRKIAKKLEKFILKKADKILPIRERLGDKVVNEFSIEREKIRVIPHGLNTKEFLSIENIDIYKNFKLDKNKKIISFVGRFSNENFIYDIIEIANLLSKKRDDFLFVLVGEGIEYNNISKIINENNYEFIKLLGFQNKDIVFNVRRISDISLCLVGGYSLLEAALAHSSLIAYNIDWHYEVVKNDQTGFLIEEGNKNEVVNKVDYLLNNERVLNELGNKAHHLILEKYDLFYTTKIKQDIYREILE